MTRTRLLLPLSLAAGLLAAVGLSSAGLPDADSGSGQSVAVIKAADGDNRNKTKNPCPYPPNRPEMVETADRFTAPAPSDVTFSGEMKANCGVGGRKVGLYGKDGPSSSAGAWTLRSTTTTNAAGTFAFRYRVAKTADFKTVWPGDETFPAAQSNSVTVKIGR